MSVTVGVAAEAGPVAVPVSVPGHSRLIDPGHNRIKIKVPKTTVLSLENIGTL